MDTDSAAVFSSIRETCFEQIVHWWKHTLKEKRWSLYGRENQYRKTVISSNSMQSTSHLYLCGFFHMADFGRKRNWESLSLWRRPNLGLLYLQHDWKDQPVSFPFMLIHVSLCILACSLYFRLPQFKEEPKSYMGTNMKKVRLSTVLSVWLVSLACAHFYFVCFHTCISSFLQVPVHWKSMFNHQNGHRFCETKSTWSSGKSF